MISYQCFFLCFTRQYFVPTSHILVILKSLVKIIGIVLFLILYIMRANELVLFCTQFE